MANDPLTQKIDEAIYEAYEELRPGLVTTIREAMAFGMTPKDIERIVRNLDPDESKAHHAQAIAEHIQRTQGGSEGTE